MRFKTFLKHILDDDFDDWVDDKDISNFAAWVKSCEMFPQTSNPAHLGLFLQEKLSPKQILGYQRAMMLYYKVPENNLPKFCIENKELFTGLLNIVLH